MAGSPLPTARPEASRLSRATVFVRAMRLDIEIGIYGHEYGRKQPLVVDVDIELAAAGLTFEHIADTVNYETVLARAQTLAAEGHVTLVETFAERLGRACLGDPRAVRVRVRVEKLQALAPHAQAAGVELVFER